MREHLTHPTRPFEVSEGMRVDELLTRMSHLGFQGRALGQAFHIFKNMLSGRCAIFFGLAGAMVPAGMRKLIVYLIENHLIDCLVSTGANLFHDAYETIGQKHYQCSPDWPDDELRKAYLDRMHDVLCDEKEFRNLEALIVEEFTTTIESGRPYTTRELLYRMGKFLKRYEQDPGILTTAFSEKLPIYCPAISDSSIGIAFHDALVKRKIHVLPDVIRDVRETGEMVRKLHPQCDVGVFYLGGGTPKNFIQQAAVVPSVQLNQDFGHKYAIQLTTDMPQWGGLSGCTFEEAKSWGKIDHNAQFVTVNVDSTIGLPILVQGIAECMETLQDAQRPIFSYDGDQVSVSFAPRFVKVAV